MGSQVRILQFCLYVYPTQLLSSFDDGPAPYSEHNLFWFRLADFDTASFFSPVRFRVFLCHCYVLMISRTLLKYLSGQNLQATFFVVGSRVIERPQVLLEEYMSGHDISVHTWSHRVRVTNSLWSDILIFCL